jgi:CubicO group peptidase (beta-lactamase class C family)
MKTLAHILGAGLLAAAALAPLAHTQTPQAPAPQTPGAQRTTPLPGSEVAVKKLIEGEISGSPDYSIMTESMANAVRAQARQTKEIYGRLGAFKSVVLKSGAGPNADLYTATYDNATVEYRVTLDAAGKMGANFRVMPGSNLPPPPPVAKLDDAALGDFIRAEMETTDFSGAVLIARDGKPVFSAARGLADREQNIANTLDTRFRVGSMNKMMTATAILQLVQAGKVKLDAPLGAYLKDYPNKDFASKVTVHQLLTHTGGAGDIFGPQFTARRLELKTLKDYVALYGSRAGEFNPGDGNRYANYGFILLGRIIEEVSGQTYSDYLRDKIFKPAGMTRTGFEPENVAVEGRAKAYVRQGAGGYSSAADTLPWSGTSAGGGYSTVRDFLAFATALTGNKLLDAKHTKLLMTRKVSNGYAYGFSDFSNADMSGAGHSGGAPGQNGDFRIIGDGKAVIVALSNVSPPGLAGQMTMLAIQRIKVTKPDGTVANLAMGPAAPPATTEQRLAAFKAADTDSDGRLDKTQFRASSTALGFGDMLEFLFAQYDADKDGFVSEAEVRTPPSTLPQPPPPT